MNGPAAPLLHQPHDQQGPGPERRPQIWLVVVLGLVVAAVVAVMGIWLLPDDSGSPVQSLSPTASTSTSASATASASSSASASVVAPAFAFAPLWPFSGVAAAATWQVAYRTSGVAAWHLDAATTAVSFTRDYLGYTEIDRVIGTPTLAGREAWVPVGAPPVEGQPRAAAVLHLVRIGAGTDAPWEVVGSEDTTLTLTIPRYYALVRSPVTVGGRITGVDESLRVQLRSLSGGRVGTAPNLPAGGTSTPWSVRATFDAPAGSVLTVAVSTGGHLYGVERFAITAVRVQ
ncbi:MAG TPA: hypothetical protein VIJ54_03235 [Actinomycetes bacterium]